MPNRDCTLASSQVACPVSSAYQHRERNDYILREPVDDAAAAHDGGDAEEVEDHARHAPRHAMVAVQALISRKDRAKTTTPMHGGIGVV